MFDNSEPINEGDGRGSTVRKPHIKLTDPVRQ